MPQAMLKTIRGGGEPADHLSSGSVININFPACAREEIKGLALTHQGLGLAYPRFMEVTEHPGPHLEEIEEHTPNMRVFRNFAGGVYR
jgi:5'-nucleotidase